MDGNTSMDTVQHDSQDVASTSISKRILSFWKPLLTASTVLAFASGFMLMVYLRQIDRVDLLQSAIASKEGLALIFTIAAILFALLFVLCFGGSYAGYIVAQFYKSHTDVPHKMESLLLVASISWCALMFCIFEWGALHSNLILAIYLTTASIAGAWIQARSESNSDDSTTETSRWRKFKTRLTPLAKGGFSGAMIAASTVFTFFAAWIFVTMNPDIGHQKPNLLLSLGLVLTAVPGLLVSNYFFRTYVRTGDVKKSGKESMLGAFAIIFYACSVVPQFTIYPVNMKALAAAGLYSTDERLFSAQEVGLLPIIRAAGFVLDESHPDAKIFRAYERFHFANKLVLCTAPYDPIAARKPAAVAPANASKKGSETVQSHDGCFDVKEGEVRRVSLKEPTSQIPSSKSTS